MCSAATIHPLITLARCMQWHTHAHPCAPSHAMRARASRSGSSAVSRVAEEHVVVAANHYRVELCTDENRTGPTACTCNSCQKRGGCFVQIRSAAARARHERSSFRAMKPLDVITPLLAGTGLVAGVFAYSTVAAIYRRGAPFVPTARQKIDAIVSHNHGLLRMLPAQRRQAMHVVDLGSGAGALVRACVRQGGFGRATGYELNPGLIAWSKFGSLAADREHFHLQDMWTADLTDADVVFVYGVPSILGRLQSKLVAEMRDGSLVVSNAFPFAAKPSSGLTLIDPGSSSNQLVFVASSSTNRADCIFTKCTRSLMLTSAGPHGRKINNF